MSETELMERIAALASECTETHPAAAGMLFSVAGSVAMGADVVRSHCDYDRPFVEAKLDQGRREIQARLDRALRN